MPHCRGQYFFYLSQDDFISPDCLEQLYRRAQETGADAVLPDMNWYYGEDEQGHPIEPAEGKPKGIIGPPEGDYSLVLDGETAFLKSIDWHIHGFSLRNTQLLQALGFDELYFTSCEYMSRRFYLNSNKVAFSHGTVYFRQNNPTAITKTFSHLFFGDYATYVRLLRLMVKHRLPKSTVAPYLKDYIKRWPQQKALYAEHKAGFTPQQQAYVATIFRRVLWDLAWVSVAQGHWGNLWRVLKLATKRPKRP